MLGKISKVFRIKKSYAFWLLVGFAVELIIGIAFWELLLVIWSLGSFMIFAVALIDPEELGEFPWTVWFPITWVLFILFACIVALYHMFRRPTTWFSDKFKGFNNWLNR